MSDTVFVIDCFVVHEYKLIAQNAGTFSQGFVYFDNFSVTSELLFRFSWLGDIIVEIMNKYTRTLGIGNSYTRSANHSEPNVS